jgi:hypothetical protein
MAEFVREMDQPMREMAELVRKVAKLVRAIQLGRFERSVVCHTTYEELLPFVCSAKFLGFPQSSTDCTRSCAPEANLNFRS